MRTLRDPDRFDAWLHRLLVHSLPRLDRPRGDAAIDSTSSSARSTDRPALTTSPAVADRDELDRALPTSRRRSARAVVVLHHYLDLPLPEAAAVLGIPLGTAKSRLHRALQQMRASIEADARLDARTARRKARMTADDRFGGSVSEWLHDRAGDGAPDYLDDVLGRTAATRQRPGWTLIGWWLPASVTSPGYPPSAVPKFGRLVLLGLLILAVVIAAIVAAGSREQRMPPPFGLARNGIVITAIGGTLYTVDPLTGARTPLAREASDGSVFGPMFSRDGTKLLYVKGLPYRPRRARRGQQGRGLGQGREPGRRGPGPGRLVT